jgi:DNA-binding transcriptional LysR family regulator
MELRQLGYFVTVAEEQNFTRAAQRLRIAQPAVSQQMQGLERELGEVLFDRTARGVRLTAAGEALLPHARATLAAAQLGRDAISSLRGLLTGHLSLGTVRHAPADLADLVGSFHQAHPGVQLKITEDHTRPLLDALRAGLLDVAYAGLGPGQRVPAGLSGRVVAAEPVVLVMRRDHVLAGEATVPLTRLRGEPMVTLPEGSGQRAMVEAAAHAAGFTPQIIAESGQLSMLTRLASQGIGVAVVPESAAKPGLELAVVPISRPALRHRLALTWREHTLTPAARAFLAIAFDAKAG